MSLNYQFRKKSQLIQNDHPFKIISRWCNYIVRRLARTDPHWPNSGSPWSSLAELWLSLIIIGRQGTAVASQCFKFTVFKLWIFQCLFINSGRYRTISVYQLLSSFCFCRRSVTIPFGTWKLHLADVMRDVTAGNLSLLKPQVCKRLYRSLCTCRWLAVLLMCTCSVWVV